MNISGEILSDLIAHIKVEMNHYTRNDNCSDERECMFCYSSYSINHRDPIAAAQQRITHSEDCLAMRLLKLYEEEADK